MRANLPRLRRRLPQRRGDAGLGLISDDNASPARLADLGRRCAATYRIRRTESGLLYDSFGVGPIGSTIRFNRHSDCSRFHDRDSADAGYFGNDTIGLRKYAGPVPLFFWDKSARSRSFVVTMVCGVPALIAGLGAVYDVWQLLPWYEYLLELNVIHGILWLLLIRAAALSRIRETQGL